MKKVLCIAVAAALVLGTVSVAQGANFVVEAKSSRVNLRAGGSMAHKIIAKLDAGSRLVAIREVGDWYRVQIPKSVPVYISAKYVRLQDETAGVVTGTRVNLRCSPSTQFSCVGTTYSGTQLKILGKAGTWLKVQPPKEARAWVYKRYMRRLNVSADVEPVARPLNVATPNPGRSAAPAPVVDSSRVAVLYSKALQKWFAGEIQAAKALFTSAMKLGKGTTYERNASTQLAIIEKVEEQRRIMAEEEASRRKESMKLNEKVMKDMLQLCEDFIKEKQDRKVEFTAVGSFASMGMFFGRRGTHKLIEDGVDTYQLRSKAVNLYDAKYYGKKVGIVGKVLTVKGTHHKIINVEKVVILK